jgi:CRP/FNR family cyclic AMP-dependent transcriptional regulator
MIERVFILKRTDLFKELPSEVLASFANHLDEIYVGEGETVFQKGDIGKAMYVVVDGRIRIHDGDKEIKVLGSDQVFGEVTVLTAEVRLLSATALEESRLLRLDQDVLYEVMAGRPAVSRGMIKVLVERLQ